MMMWEWADGAGKDCFCKADPPRCPNQGSPCFCPGYCHPNPACPKHGRIQEITQT